MGFVIIVALEIMFSLAGDVFKFNSRRDVSKNEEKGNSCNHIASLLATRMKAYLGLDHSWNYVTSAKFGIVGRMHVSASIIETMILPTERVKSRILYIKSLS